jgi:hypothetical protein
METERIKSSGQARLCLDRNSGEADLLNNIFFIILQYTEAVVSNNYCATNSGSPEVKLRFCP